MFNRKMVALVGAYMLVNACSRSTPRTPAATIPFKTLVSDVRTIALQAPADARLNEASSAVVSGSEIVVTDPNSADVKVFSRKTGSLARLVGRPGDAPGEFRRPLNVVALDSGRYVVFDARRRVLSFRDSLGALIGDTRQLKGSFNGIVALPGEHRVVLSGSLINTKVAGNTELHEYDYEGRRIASYGEGAKPGSLWESTFAAVFAADVAGKVVSGAMNSNVVRVYDRATKATKAITVAPNWFEPLEWPSDRLLSVKGSPQTSAQRMKDFLHTHRMMNGIIPLAGDRFLVRFMAFTSPNDKAFYYAVSDTTGRTLAVSQATRANIVAARGDTVFWISKGDAGTSRLGSGVVTDVNVAAHRLATMR